jgi:hypothetical protein
MNILALEKQKRSTASAPVGDSVIRPAAASSIKSIMRTVLAILCCSFFAIGPAHGQSDETDAQPATLKKIPSPMTLFSGNYQGVWRDENGATGEWFAKLDVEGESIRGELSLTNVGQYSGDKIRGKTFENDDGTMGVEFKTRDGKWKSKAIFDGQLLIGTFYYTSQSRRVQELRKGEWAAQRVPDDS